MEDDESMRHATRVHLEKEGYETTAAFDVPHALDILKTSPHDLVITDLNLPGPSGLELLKSIRAEYPDTMVIVITGYGTVETAVDAMKCGAYDYLAKPVHPYELKTLVNRALERRKLIEEVRTLRGTIDQKFGFENIIGRSPALMQVLDSAARVAQTDVTVLVLGETGTGKELLAKAIHVNSPRHERPFVTINCGAIPRDLLESELFGYVKGAFTGALNHKKGKVEMADGGTIFLDEIGEMPLDLQVRLLRLIQEREIEKVGAPVPVQVDVRIIAATHRNLQELVADHTFRDDLYYRLSEIVVTIPPLRQREGDAALLAHHFKNKFCAQESRASLHFGPDALAAIEGYQWPGNVREMENCIKRAVIMADANTIVADDLGLPDTGAEEEPLNLRQVRDEAEYKAIARALARTDGNIVKASEMLGVSRPTLYDLMGRHGIKVGT